MVVNIRNRLPREKSKKVLKIIGSTNKVPTNNHRLFTNIFIHSFHTPGEGWWFAFKLSWFHAALYLSLLVQMMVDKMKNQSSYQPAGLMRKLNNSEYELRKHFEKNNIKVEIKKIEDVLTSKYTVYPEALYSFITMWSKGLVHCCESIVFVQCNCVSMYAN